jgi:hypothetical protein
MRKKYQAFLLNPDGRREDVNPKNGKDFKLDELQGLLGGNIQILHMRHGELMVINEDGKLLDLPLNKDSTVIAKWKGVISSKDCIVGTVLVCHKSQIK